MPGDITEVCLIDDPLKLKSGCGLLPLEESSKPGPDLNLTLRLGMPSIHTCNGTQKLRHDLQTATFMLASSLLGRIR